MENTKLTNTYLIVGELPLNLNISILKIDKKGVLRECIWFTGF